MNTAAIRQVGGSHPAANCILSLKHQDRMTGLRQRDRRCKAIGARPNYHCIVFLTGQIVFFHYVYHDSAFPRPFEFVETNNNITCGFARNGIEISAVW